MAYPRKRAPVACNYCRHRKRKCDGEQPLCGLCAESGIDCEYQDDRYRQEQITDVIPRLAEIEELLQRQNEMINTLCQNMAQVVTVVCNSAEQYLSGQNHLFSPNANTPSRVYPTPLGMEEGKTNSEEITFTIPVGHHTTTPSLFSCQSIRTLIGDYPEDFFFQIESQRESQIASASMGNLLVSVELNKEMTDHLVSQFFAHISPELPLLEQEVFLTLYENFLNLGPRDDSDTALCLVVFALGKLASNLLETEQGDLSNDGMEFFSPAYQFLLNRWADSSGLETSLPLGLVFASVYLCYMMKPVQAWKLVYLASTHLQLMTVRMNGKDVSQEDRDCINRLYWACFVLECDGIAEFHLPRSGIELAIDRMAYPHFNSQNDPDRLTFLAICSARQLMNRIHNVIYSTGNTPPVESLETVSTELSHQLDTWYHSLPDAIRPDLSVEAPRHKREGWLRLRYWSSKHIIYRPCLLYVASLSDGHAFPPHILVHCRTCLDGCRRYINVAYYMLMERTHHIWTTLQSVLACSLLLTIASTSPLLKQLVPDISPILSKAIECTERWASPDSSAESILWILKTIRQKVRILK